jgi:transposase
LPPYSPDLNLIELAFGILKSHLKADYDHYYTDARNIAQELSLYVVERQKIPVGAIVDQEGSEIYIKWEIMCEME